MQKKDFITFSKSLFGFFDDFFIKWVEKHCSNKLVHAEGGTLLYKQLGVNQT